MQIIKNIKIDLASKGICPVVDAMQGEELSRSVKIDLYDNSSPFALTEVKSVMIGFKKPDGKSGLYDRLPNGESAYDNFQLADNSITIHIAPAALEVAGIVKMVIILQDGDESRIATFPIQVNVEENPAYGQKVSNDYYAVTSLSELNNYLKDFMKNPADSDLNMRGHAIHSIEHLGIMGNAPEEAIDIIPEQPVPGDDAPAAAVLNFRAGLEVRSGLTVLRSIGDGVQDDDAATVGQVKAVDLTIEKTWTEKQKAQARQNIGAISDGDSVRSLGFVGSRGPGFYFETQGTGVIDEGGSIHPVACINELDNDLSVVLRNVHTPVAQRDAANKGYVDDAIADSGVFYVTVTETEDGKYVADKTFDEIKAAHEEGRIVKAVAVDGAIIPLVEATNDFINVSGVVNGTEYSGGMYNDGTVWFSVYTYSTIAYVDEAIANAIANLPVYNGEVEEV